MAAKLRYWISNFNEEASRLLCYLFKGMLFLSATTDKATKVDKRLVLAHKMLGDKRKQTRLICFEQCISFIMYA
jgi:hypothetical protein